MRGTEVMHEAVEQEVLMDELEDEGECWVKKTWWQQVITWRDEEMREWFRKGGRKQGKEKQPICSRMMNRMEVIVWKRWGKMEEKMMPNIFHVNFSAGPDQYTFSQSCKSAVQPQAHGPEVALELMNLKSSWTRADTTVNIKLRMCRVPSVPAIFHCLCASSIVSWWLWASYPSIF